MYPYLDIKTTKVLANKFALMQLKYYGLGDVVHRFCWHKDGKGQFTANYLDLKLTGPVEGGKRYKISKICKRNLHSSPQFFECPQYH